MSLEVTLVAILLSWLIATSNGLDNGLGLTPQMGWNSWNHFHCEINASVIRDTADAIVSKGLQKAGYVYVNIDDCWAGSRAKDGTVQPDPKAFPGKDAMMELGHYIHSKGLLYGIYSDAGSLTCQKRPGSLGYEYIDAKMYAEWGVDYLKYDNCYDQGVAAHVRYQIMRDALLKTKRPIFYSLCDGGGDNVSYWGSSVGNSWRTTADIHDLWVDMLANIDYNDQSWKYAARGGWNDPDMLEVGNGGMTLVEYTTHFSLWALVKAPLIIGGDVRNLGDEELAILTNAEVIAINQDRLGVQGHKVKSDNDQEVWAGPLMDGSVAVILLNRSNSTSSITAYWTDIGLHYSQNATVRDLWAHKDIGVHKSSIAASVRSHGCVMYRITPQ